jgi:hypothetical protein
MEEDNQDRELQREDRTDRLSMLWATPSILDVIPTEDLAGIFMMCLEGYTAKLPSITSKFPWTLGQVCAPWRDVLWRASSC